MRMLKLRWGFFTLILVALAACQPQADVLPTLIDLEAIGAATAEAQTAMAPTATATRLIATLPPTFTPTDEPTATPEPAVLASSTPPGFSADGRILYIYNGDSIVMITADGARTELIVTFGVGQPLRELALSPDGQYLAFTGPGNGLAREVFISNLDGTYLQRITCLNYQDIADVTWTPDSTGLVFFGAAIEGGARDVIAVNIAGATDCPAGNSQRVLIPLGTDDARGLTFNRAGTLLFYGLRNPLFAYDVATGESTRYTFDTRVGPDFSPAQNPVSDRLAYLATLEDSQRGRGGALVIIEDSSFAPERPFAQRATPYLARRVLWSPRGDILLLLIPDNVILISNTGTISTVSDMPLVLPYAAMSPDSSQVAYTTVDGNGIVQIYLRNLRSGAVRQLTAHPEGTATDLIWVAG